MAIFDPDDDSVDYRGVDIRVYGSVNKAFLLERGWTRTAIKRILGEPDSRIARRDRPKDRPECRYDVARVLAAEDAGPTRFRQAPKRRGDPNDEADESETAIPRRYCQYCGSRLHSGIGRPRKYCSSLCRNRALREAKKYISRD
jgi:hypothetical protein